MVEGGVSPCMHNINFKAIMVQEILKCVQVNKAKKYLLRFVLHHQNLNLLREDIPKKSVFFLQTLSVRGGGQTDSVASWVKTY